METEADPEPPAPFGTLRPSERRALIGCTFASGCILLMPQELIGAGISFTLALALTAFHLVRSRRERAQAQVAATAE